MLTLNDIKVGMRVNSMDLLDIYGVTILLHNVVPTSDGMIGDIFYIGERNASTMESSLRDVTDAIMIIENLYEDEEVSYDE